MNKPIDISDYDSLDDLYEDVRLLIWSLCHQFAKKYGGDVEEHFANANSLFMRAFQAYEPEKGGAFSTILRAHVWGGLLDMVRLASTRNAKLPRTSDVEINYAVDRHHFDVLAFKRSLSRDAALVVHMTLMMQGRFERTLAGIEKAGKKKAQAKSNKMRLILQRELLDWGWERDRIKAAFRELSLELGVET